MGGAGGRGGGGLVSVHTHVSSLYAAPGFFNPFTPKSDQFQISPAASPRTLHDSVKNLAFHSFQMKMIILPKFLPPHLYISLQMVGKMYFLNWGVKGLIYNLSFLRALLL